MLEFPDSYEPPNTGCADQHVRPFRHVQLPPEQLLPDYSHNRHDNECQESNAYKHANPHPTSAHPSIHLHTQNEMR